MPFKESVLSLLYTQACTSETQRKAAVLEFLVISAPLTVVAVNQHRAHGCIKVDADMRLGAEKTMALAGVCALKGERHMALSSFPKKSQPPSAKYKFVSHPHVVRKQARYALRCWAVSCRHTSHKLACGRLILAVSVHSTVPKKPNLAD